MGKNDWVQLWNPFSIFIQDGKLALAIKVDNTFGRRTPKLRRLFSSQLVALMTDTVEKVGD